MTCMSHNLHHASYATWMRGGLGLIRVHEGEEEYLCIGFTRRKKIFSVKKRIVGPVMWLMWHKCIT